MSTIRERDRTLGPHAPYSEADQWEMLSDRRALLVALDGLVEAGELPRNVLIQGDSDFKGEWVSVPREDFETLRAALSHAKEVTG